MIRFINDAQPIHIINYYYWAKHQKPAFALTHTYTSHNLVFGFYEIFKDAISFHLIFMKYKKIKLRTANLCKFHFFAALSRSSPFNEAIKTHICCCCCCANVSITIKTFSIAIFSIFHSNFPHYRSFAFTNAFLFKMNEIRISKSKKKKWRKK